METKTVHTPTPEIKRTIAQRMRAHRKYYSTLKQEAPRMCDGTRIYQLEDAADIAANDLLKAVQRASGRRKHGRYTFESVSDSVQVLIYTEDAIAKSETVCVVEHGPQHVLFIEESDIAHPELLDELAGLCAWQIGSVDGLIAHAAKEWAYA